MGRKLLLERLERLATVLDDLMPRCAELVRDAIALLKEQEPVKPRLAASKSCYDHCGVCNRLLPVYRGQRSNFCPGCGKPVKWDE